MKKAQATALLTVLGLVGTLAAPVLAETKDKEQNGTKNSKGVAGKEVKKEGKQGADSACGEGSCGTDDKGAAAAKKAHGKGAGDKAPAKAKGK